jgi:Ca-activated chloride channel family protein
MCSPKSQGVLRFCLILLAAGLFLFGATRQTGAAASAQEQPAKPPARPPRTMQPPAQTQEQDQDRPQGQAAISVAVDLVTLQALVTDPKGNVIMGLKPENFKIYEDNVEQQITHFASVDANITVVMLVEYSRQVSRFIYEVWDAIYGFANTLKEGDWVAVIGYDIRPEILSDFTQDKQKLYDTLRRFNYPAFLESNLSDALIFTLDRVEEIEGKVAVLLVSTGLDTFSRATYDDALKKCKASNASIYAISLGQNFRIRADAAGMISPQANMDLLMADNRLRYFTEFTGGAAYFPRFTTEFPSIFHNISALLRNQYSISYASSNPKKDGKFRKIRVEVSADYNNDGKPDKVKVTTRSGYLAKER